MRRLWWGQWREGRRGRTKKKRPIAKITAIVPNGGGSVINSHLVLLYVQCGAKDRRTRFPPLPPSLEYLFISSRASDPDRRAPREQDPISASERGGRRTGETLHVAAASLPPNLVAPPISCRSVSVWGLPFRRGRRGDTEMPHNVRELDPCRWSLKHIHPTYNTAKGRPRNHSLRTFHVTTPRSPLIYYVLTRLRMLCTSSKRHFPNAPIIQTACKTCSTCSGSLPTEAEMHSGSVRVDEGFSLAIYLTGALESVVRSRCATKQVL
jgi:hypothetical protein